MHPTPPIAGKSLRSARLRRLFPRAEAQAPADGKPLLPILRTALWFGCLAGISELATVFIERTLLTRITMESLRTSRYFVAMIPLGDLALFAGFGLLIGVMFRSRPALGRTVGASCCAGCLALTLLLRVDGLYPVARGTLSLGIAATTARWMWRIPTRLDWLVRRSLPFLTAGLSVVVAAGFAWSATSESRALRQLPTPASATPNVLLLVLDNVRAASMSLHGFGRKTTPNLERIARNGVRFDAARSTASWTLPSHASMFTGHWPERMSVGWDRALDASYPTLAESLANRGYATAGFAGNIYYCNERYGLGRGFARYDDFYENQTISPLEALRSTSLGRLLLGPIGWDGRPETCVRKTAALLNGDLLDWLDRRPAERPFFAFVNYYDAHAPCVLPEGANRKFGRCNEPEHDRIEALKRYQWMNAHGRPPKDWDAWTVDRDAVEIMRDSYESCIAYIDDQIGRLYADLESRGLLENTLIIVTSDHGEHFKEHGFLGHGQSVYRREVDVPLLVIPPSSPVARRVVPEPVSLRDIPATVFDYLAPGTQALFPGRSLARFWTSDTPDVSVATPVVSQVGHKENVPPMEKVPSSLGAVRSVLFNGHVFIKNTNGHIELFDLKIDPFERTNLVYTADSGEMVARYRDLLDEALRDDSAGSMPTSVPNRERHMSGSD